MEPDDRTTRARIRDAAIIEIAAAPSGRATARVVAARAGVSPGSIIHHFGSMAGLRRACNEHVTSLIRKYKTDGVQNPLAFDPLTVASQLGELPVTAYIASVATSESEEVDELIDLMVRDATDYMEAGVASGTLSPSEHPRDRAALLVLWSLGALVLHEHTERILGVDLTAPDMIASPSAGAYVRTAFEILASGIIAEGVADQFLKTINDYYPGGEPEAATAEDVAKGTP
jgi:AcrR family transcriptional regulator